MSRHNLLKKMFPFNRKRLNGCLMCLWELASVTFNRKAELSTHYFQFLMRTTFATCLIINWHLSHLFSLKKWWMAQTLGSCWPWSKVKEVPSWALKMVYKGSIHRRVMNTRVDDNDSDVAPVLTEWYLLIRIQWN